MARSMLTRTRPPAAAALLGYGGLIPFIAGAAGLALGGQWALQAANALPIYAAVILSFLAGGRWAGEIILRPEAPGGGVLALSFLIGLSGWLAVLLQVWSGPRLPFNGEYAGWGLLIFGFVLSWLWDQVAVSSGVFPRWYGPMRAHLTLGAVLCLAAALWLRMSGPIFS